MNIFNLEREKSYIVNYKEITDNDDDVPPLIFELIEEKLERNMIKLKFVESCMYGPPVFNVHFNIKVPSGTFLVIEYFPTVSDAYVDSGDIDFESNKYMYSNIEHATITCSYELLQNTYANCPVIECYNGVVPINLPINKYHTHQTKNGILLIRAPVNTEETKLIASVQDLILDVEINDERPVFKYDLKNMLYF